MNAPRVSVVIPLRDAGPHVEELLAALDAQTLPRAEREHLVALAPSSDDARRQLEAARRAGRIDALIDNPTGLAATGLNLAIARAGGEIVVRLDARTRPEPNYLAAAASALDRTGAAAVGGAMILRGRGPGAAPSRR
ncbi:MAG: glycosyltransferase [Planctomycetota bacterium]